jgi:hypothetical protein
MLKPRNAAVIASVASAASILAIRAIFMVSEPTLIAYSEFKPC